MACPLILLAGGKSSRMQKPGTVSLPKGLLPFRDSCWLTEQLQSFSFVDKVVIVLGYDAKKYLEAISFLESARASWTRVNSIDLSVVINDRPELGSFSSLQLGCKALAPTEWTSAFVLPIDVPAPAPQVFASLARAMAERSYQVAVPTFQGKSGHPVLVARKFAESLLSMDAGGERARLDFLIHELAADEVTKIPVTDPHTVLNLNTPEEWSRFIHSSKD